MVNEIISWITIIVDLAFIIGCAIYLLYGFPQEVVSPLWKRVAAWTGYGVLVVFLPLLRNDIVTVGILTAYYVWIGRLLYYRNKMGILYQLIYSMIFLATQYMSTFLVLGIIGTMGLEPLLLQCVLVIVRIVLLFLATWLLRIILLKRYVKQTENLKIRGMIIVPVFSAALLIMYVISSDIFLFRYGYEWLLLYAILLVIINLYCLYFWYDVAQTRELEHRLKLTRRQNQMTLQYYEELEKNYANSRKIIHDIRNHLAVLEQAEKMENRSYIADLHELLNSLGMKFYTENRMLNIILNDKLKSYPPKMVDCRLGGINLDFLSDMDTTTIFANLLDNAREAMDMSGGGMRTDQKERATEEEKKTAGEEKKLPPKGSRHQRQASDTGGTDS